MTVIYQAVCDIGKNAPEMVESGWIDGVNECPFKGQRIEAISATSAQERLGICNHCNGFPNVERK